MLQPQGSDSRRGTSQAVRRTAIAILVTGGDGGFEKPCQPSQIILEGAEDPHEIVTRQF